MLRSEGPPAKPAPSFRPNLALSHFVYKGPEKRDYVAAIPEMRRRVENPGPPAPPAERNFYRDLPSDGHGLWSGVAILLLFGALVLTVAWMVHLGCTPFGCR